jgi:predicted AAA+ superfamily ATPase
MQRNLFGKLEQWKTKEGRKPLIIEGARQVGKTWIMKEFGRACFEDVAYFNFEPDKELQSIFEPNIQAHVLLEKLGFLRERKITPRTLIVFDEIQECPRALNSLKYFCEDAPEYAVVAAGSLLGTYLARPHSYPVGKVDIATMHPLSFEEFLRAVDESLFGYYITINSDTIIDEIFHNRLIEIWQKYLIVGGLPECVSAWLSTGDPALVLEKQQDIQKIYERDFTKHNGKINAAKILMVFRNVAAQLAKENKKFIYGDIQRGARARSFEEAIEWLVTANLINRVYRAAKNAMPLNVYTDLSAFKLYLFDTGLLKFMSGATNEGIILNEDFPFKGALTENFVLQELNAQFIVPPKYFTFEHYENDFLIQARNGDIVPVEVKAGKNVSSPSFRAYNERFSPRLRIRYSMLNYQRDGNLINIPFYLIGKTNKLIEA